MTSSPAFTITRLGPDTPADKLQAIGEVVDAAFHDTPLDDLLTGHDQALGIARSVALVTTTALDLELYVAQTPAGDIAGVMCVKPPGFEHRKSPNVNGPHAQAVDALVEQYPQVKADVDELVEQVTELKRAAYGPDELTPLAYISHLAVAPAWQGKGVGAALMRHLGDKLNGERVSLLAVSPGLVPWYGRFGLQLLGEKEVVVGEYRIMFYAMAT